ncbi:hypothetical protein G7068_05065 [Leucobacter viscericola]|uniref:Lipid/polyisoprenoid-binding YceI-like domain-containing protein n=1 Tax=Leucobacter viscericola TaxID=2714935 RepID=A0A6G7XDX7_9MICO|nr:hypothetical protein [Leucobacter viscericola]QIK62649.1 hypothetical protein G7068_05065 [Leucobacter viscericola]
MFSILATRTSRSSLGVIAIVTLPLCLVSCASTQGVGAPAAELRAATGSNLLTVPAEHVYEVTDVKLLAPAATSALGKSVQDHVDPSGFMVMHDGVITQAELSVSLAGLHEASFVLTEPTVLRREGRDDSVVYATGTLSVEGIEQRSTQLKLTPSQISDKAAEFDVSFALPKALLIAGGAAGVGEVSAHISLTAEDQN